MLMIEIGETEEVIYPDEMEEQPAIPVILPVPVPAELRCLFERQQGVPIHQDLTSSLPWV